MACEAEKAIKLLEKASKDTSKPRTAKAAEKALENLGEDTMGSEGDMVHPAWKKNREDTQYKHFKGLIGSTETVYYQKTTDGKVDGGNYRVAAVERRGDGVSVRFTKGKYGWVRAEDIGSKLNSEEDTGFDYTEETVVPNVMNSIDNIVEMGQILEEMDKNKIDPKLSKYYDELAKILPVDAIPKMMYHLNTEAEKTGGQIKGAKVSLNVSQFEKMLNTDMSAKEVHWHEILHAYTKFAINASQDPEVYKVTRQLEQMRRVLMKRVTPEMLMPEKSIDYDAELKVAERRWDYIFNSKNNLHELVAYSMTNPAMIRELKKIKLDDKKTEHKNMFQKLTALATRLLDWVLGRDTYQKSGKTGYDAMLQLTMDLMQHNNRMEKKLEDNASLENKFMKMLEKGDVGIVKMGTKVKEMLVKNDIEPYPEDGSKFARSVWAAKNLPNLMLNENLGHVREMVMMAIGMQPEGFINNIVRDVSLPSELERTIEYLGLASDQIDAVREYSAKAAAKGIRDAMPNMTELDEEAMTYVAMDLDLEALTGSMDTKRIIEVVKDGRSLNAEIANREARLKELDPQNANWNIQQSKGLGKYLATHEASMIQSLNAENIATRVLTGKKIKANPEVVKVIDELASLYGVKNSAKSGKEIFTEYAEKNPDAIENLLSHAKHMKDDARKKVFRMNTNMIKGYSKEIFDDTIDVMIRPMDQTEDLQAQGYKVEYTLEKDPKDPHKKQLAMFKKTSFAGDTYNRAATRFTNMKKRGTSLTDVGYLEDNEKLAQSYARNTIRKMDKLREKLAKDIDAGKGVDIESRLLPVMDDAGNVVNYRYIMTKAEKKELLNQDTRIAEVVGKTLSSVQDKVDTERHNKSVLDVIKEDQRANYIEGSKFGKNKKPYIRIENNSPNLKVQEIYRILPTNMKEAIKRSENGYIAVRQDMLHNYFGYREGTILAIDFLDKYLPKVMKMGIKLAEDIWKEVIKISKVDIIIRTPAVFIGNVVSNLMYTVMYRGASPKVLLETVKMTIDNLRATRDYIDTTHKIEKLMLDARLGKDVSSRIAGLKESLKRNPVHDLMEAGMYQVIVDDVGTEDFKSNNRLSRWINEKTDGVPEWVNQGTHWLYLTDQTPVFKFMTQATQMSDFVARATQYQIMKKSGVSKKKALNHVLDVFINYNKPASRFEEYLNNMGLIMFTKYAKRIQRAIQKDIRQRPLHVLLAVLGQEMLLDTDDVYEQSVFTKSWVNFGINPLDHLERALVPTTLEIL